MDDEGVVFSDGERVAYLPGGVVRKSTRHERPPPGVAALRLLAKVIDMAIGGP